MGCYNIEIATAHVFFKKYLQQYTTCSYQYSAVNNTTKCKTHSADKQDTTKHLLFSKERRNTPAAVRPNAVRRAIQHCPPHSAPLITVTYR